MERVHNQVCRENVYGQPPKIQGFKRRRNEMVLKIIEQVKKDNGMKGQFLFASWTKIDKLKFTFMFGYKPKD